MHSDGSFRPRIRRFIRLFWFFIIAGLAFGTGTSAGTGARPVVFSASEVDYPPFCMTDESGQAIGFSVELMRAALAAMGRDVTFRVGPWAEVRTWLERGEVEALPLVGRTPEREALFDFTFPYMSLHGAIVVRKDSRDIFDLKDLRGKRVAVMKGDNAEEFLRREDRGMAIHATATFEDALRELSEGRCDAVVVQRLVAIRLIQETGLKNLRIVNRPIEGFRQDFCFAVREGDRETLALLNEGLALVMADGTYRHLHAKWFAALELPDNRRIVIGGDHNYPPYEYLDEKGRPAGYNVELTRAIATELGLNVEIRLAPWAEVREALARGEIDALQGMFYSPQRDLTFDFTPPHTVNHCVGVVRKGETPPPATLAELEGKRIVLQRGDIMHDFAVENGLEREITAVDAQEDALRELAEGKHDVALVSRLTALYWIEKYGWENLVVGSRPFLSPEYCYAVPNGQKALLAHFSEGLRTLEENGEYRRIYEKWMGIYEAPSPRFVDILRHLTMVAVPLLLILLTSFVWSWTLRRQVASRTAALRESEEFQRAVIACLPVALYSIDLDGNVLTWNASAEKIFGWTAGEIIGRPLPIVPGDKQDEYRELRERVMKGEVFEAVEVTRCKKDGSCFDGRLSVAPINDARGRIIGIMGAMEDITQSKQAERSLRENEALFRNLFEGHAAVKLIIDPENGRIVDANRAAEDFYGWPRHRLKTMRIQDINIASVGEIKAAMDKVRSRSRVRFEFRHRLADGSIRDVEVYSSPIEIGGQSLLHSIIHDVTERKRTEAERERLLLAIEQSGEMIVITDPQGIIEYVNPAFERTTGHAREDVVGRPLCAFHGNDQKPPFCHEDWKARCSGGSWRGRLVSRYLDGALHTEDVSISPVLDASGRIVNFVAVMRDVTDEIRLADQLQRAQKMESVGRLAGGVAHDFNNMLGVIIGYAELAMDRVAPSDPVRADLGEILKAAKRSTEITRQLLAFARRQPIRPQLLDLNATVEDMLKMLRRLIGEDIDLAWLPGTGLWPVRLDPAQIDQILANLCINARDAIGGVGKVTLETKNVTFDEAYCSTHAGHVPGDFVMLAVSDDGCGMDRETQEQIFEPFFTTKGVDRGTGLGLATVYGIVKQNNGFIHVYSEAGAGTTFRIYLPRHREAVEAKSPESAGEIPQGRGETVLLVEDEPAILKMGRMMLEQLGYRVLAAATPNEALSMVEAQSGGIQLLITDVVMPEMNGRELADKVQDRIPGLKVLFMSGYTADVIAHRGVLDRDVRFLPKPFMLKDLAMRVREALDGK